MDPYAVNMMPGTSVVAYILLLHASIIAHAQDPFSEFASRSVHTDCYGPYRQLIRR